MMPEILAVLAMGAVCGLWIVFQQWIARVDPEGRGVQGGCGTCGGGTCRNECRSENPEAGAREAGEVVAGRFGEESS